MSKENLVAVLQTAWGKFTYVLPLLLLASPFILISLVGLPALRDPIRLLRSGHTEPVVIENGHFLIVGGGGGPGGTLVDRTARVSGREFPADKLYQKGDHAFLTYSKPLDYGVITQQPPRSVFQIIAADGTALHAATFPIFIVVALIVTNLLLILGAVLLHMAGPDLTKQLSEKSGRFQRGITIGTSSLEALLAATISFVPIAAASAAFSVAIQMKSDTLSSLCIVYLALLLLLGSHVAAGTAVGLLKFLQSRFGRGLKQFVAFGGSLLAALHILRKIVDLTFSERVANVSSWWEVAKTFVETLFN